MSDNEIREHGDIAILDFAQKYSGLKCQTLLYYTFREAETCDVRQLLEKLQNIRTYEEDIMSVAQKIEQGLQQGLQQGPYNRVGMRRR